MFKTVFSQLVLFMDVQFVSTDFLLSTGHWFFSGAFAERRVTPEIGAALRHEGLLTAALQKAYNSPSSVMCQRQTAWVDGQADRGIRRDVLIKVGERACVAAATLMPHSVLAQHPWLATMGNNPLGEMLEKHARYQRGPFEFTHLSAGVILPTASESAVLWARRYRFFLADGHLIVTEIFFPGVLERLGTPM